MAFTNRLLESAVIQYCSAGVYNHKLRHSSKVGEKVAEVLLGAAMLPEGPDLKLQLLSLRLTGRGAASPPGH